MTSTTAGKDLWLRRFQPARPGAGRLICFPHAGGSASYYLPLARELGPGVDVLAVQYPGRQDRRREPCIDSIAQLAAEIRQILAGWTDVPYAFFGHSMGAVVAFEVARGLAAQRLPGPRWLFVSGRRAPHLIRQENVHTRDDRGVLAEVRRVGGTDQRFLDDAEIVAMIMPVLRNDYKAIETYACTPGTPLDCPITALVGDRDPQASVADVRAWAAHTTGPLEVQVFPGGHFYLDSNRPAVAAVLAGPLARMPADPPVSGRPVG